MEFGEASEGDRTTCAKTNRQKMTETSLGLKIYWLDYRNFGFAYLREGKVVKLEIHRGTPPKRTTYALPSRGGVVKQRSSVIR